MIKVNDVEYIPKRLKLKRWFELEVYRGKINIAVDNKDLDSLIDNIVSYVHSSLGISKEILEDLEWKEVIQAFIEVSDLNQLNLDIPVFKQMTKDKDKKELWDYEGRIWYAWAYLFSKTFSWTMDIVSELEVDDAFKMMQEILINDQLSKEWEWMLSENSVGYDESTKKSKFNPLPRPDWMKSRIEEPKKLMIPKILIPIGNVVSYKSYEPEKNFKSV